MVCAFDFLAEKRWILGRIPAKPRG
jgi:hypothetical protein